MGVGFFLVGASRRQKEETLLEAEPMEVSVRRLGIWRVICGWGTEERCR